MALPIKQKPNPQFPISFSHLAWTVLIFGAILLLGTSFVTSWNSSGPTFFSPEQFSSPSLRLSFSSSAPKNSDSSVFTAAALSSYSPSARSIPEFLQPPGQPWFLFCPALAAACLCILLPLIPFNNWTRLIVKSLILLEMLCYFVWRTLATLNLSDWASTIFSLLFYSVEIIGFLSFILHTIHSIWSTACQRSTEADCYSQDVLSGKYLPWVDVFIPTYSEPEFIVRRTVIGCQAMDYANKNIYILDDTRRPHIRNLAEELGCKYITRPDNKHAKAGNLNHAWPKTTGELIAILDADFVPFKNFLTRTVGFFQQFDVALVQTPQKFYNPDHHVRNLGLDHLVHDDLADFFEFDQSTRDLFNAALCCGTSYVVRRSALEAVGGYNTICLAEDSPTSITMLTLGYRIIYLKEILSMGESTRTHADFIKQRTRWHHSNYQIFCCGKIIPIWSNLNLAQKSVFVNFFIGSFQPLFRVFFLLTPLFSLCLGLSPILTTPTEILYYFVPYILVVIGTTAWGTEYHSSFFWNDVYETLLCFPLLKCLILSIRDPFGLPFKVTRKGVKYNKKNYNLEHTWPLLVTIALMIAVLCLHLVSYLQGVGQAVISPGLGILLFLLVYNIVVSGIAVLAAIDQPERRIVDRFPLQISCQLKINDFSNRNTMTEYVYQGYTKNLSEKGALVTLTSGDFTTATQLLLLEFTEEGFSVEAQLCRCEKQGNVTQVALKFINPTLQQNQKLVEMLYTDMTWWKRSKRPGNLDVLIALCVSFLKLRSLLTKYS
ncbi:MAG: glycosyltransferase [Chroococcidiopsidaceae cyanobacterium CP_BM_RX_35]|nr:glycosyltransferase [Chroococcidiopsidaceae cyanobacterium CP_BM_RX_35]